MTTPSIIAVNQKSFATGRPERFAQPGRLDTP